MQNILSLFDWRRTSEQEKSEEITRLQMFVNRMFEQYFGPLLNEYAANQQSVEGDVKKKLLALFDKSVTEVFKTGHPTAVQVLQVSFHTKEIRAINYAYRTYINW